jgi:hypothetical protein
MHMGFAYVLCPRVGLLKLLISVVKVQIARRVWQRRIGEVLAACILGMNF